MLSRLALAATFTTLLSYTTAAPVHGLEARDDNGLGTPRQIRWSNTQSGEGQPAPGEYCLNVNAPGFSSRTIGISACVDGGPGTVDGSGHPADVQLFYYNLGATQIKVQDTTTGEISCVDFGNPSNGSPITIAACDANAPGQKLYITDDFHIAVENGPGQCMDVQAESAIQPTRPYGILKSVQNWQCYGGNENQIFIFPDAPTPPEPQPEPPLGEARQIRWLKTTPEEPGQAAPGEYCLNVNSPGFSSRTIGIGGCVSGGPGDVDGSGHPADVQLFYYNLGATKIKVKDTASNEVFCVDFGNNPTNGGRITIETCNDNAPGQKLYITDDLHIAVENGPGQCMDVQAESGIQNVRPYGILKSVQSWTCVAGNENQIFIFPNAPSPPKPEPPLGEPRQIRWTNTKSGEGQPAPGEYCLNVNSPGFSSRTIGISTCVSGGPGAIDGSGHPADVQLFYYNLGATQIKVQDTTTSEVFCVDFGNPTNGSPITIATCDANAPGQKLFITDDHHIAVENGPGQCMDVQAESGIQPVRPYGILKSIQSWQCVFGNENQIFIFP